MATLKKRRGMWYARKQWRDENGTRKEKQIPLRTQSKVTAIQRLSEIKKVESDMVDGLSFSFPWLNNDGLTKIKVFKLEDAVNEWMSHRKKKKISWPPLVYPRFTASVRAHRGPFRRRAGRGRVLFDPAQGRGRVLFAPEPAPPPPGRCPGEAPSAMNADGKITTKDLDAAVAALRSGRCTALYGRRAGWGDAGAARLADALAADGGRGGARRPRAGPAAPRGRGAAQAWPGAPAPLLRLWRAFIGDAAVAEAVGIGWLVNLKQR